MQNQVDKHRSENKRGAGVAGATARQDGGPAKYGSRSLIALRTYMPAFSGAGSRFSPVWRPRSMRQAAKSTRSVWPFAFSYPVETDQTAMPMQGIGAPWHRKKLGAGGRPLRQTITNTSVELRRGDNRTPGAATATPAAGSARAGRFPAGTGTAKDSPRPRLASHAARYFRGETRRRRIACRAD